MVGLGGRRIELQLFLRAVRRLPEIWRAIVLFRNWGSFVLLYSGIRKFPGKFVVQSRSGLSIVCVEAVDVTTVWVVWCGRDYHLPVTARTVLDLGANIGAFSLFAAAYGKVESVVSLEPMASTCERLRENVVDNRLEKLISVHELGVAGETGTRTIWAGVGSAHSSMFQRNDPAWETGEKRQIAVIGLAELFATLGRAEWDCVKMDCEGGEVEAVLRADNATLRRMKFVAMEYHFPGSLAGAETALFAKLEEAGFKCVKHKRRERLAWFRRN